MRDALLVVLAASALGCNVNWQHPSAGMPGNDPPPVVASGGEAPPPPPPDYVPPQDTTPPCDPTAGSCDAPAEVDPAMVCSECIDAMCADAQEGDELDVCVASNCAGVCP